MTSTMPEPLLDVDVQEVPGGNVSDISTNATDLDNFYFYHASTDQRQCADDDGSAVDGW